MRTETELPPFAIGPSGAHPCETFTVERTGQRKRLSHTHGEIQFDVDTDEIEVGGARASPRPAEQAIRVITTWYFSKACIAVSPPW